MKRIRALSKPKPDRADLLCDLCQTFLIPAECLVKGKCEPPEDR
jgi:hypothetical protein